MVANINVDITSIVIMIIVFVLVDNVNIIVIVAVIITVFLLSHLLWRFHQFKSKHSFPFRILRSMIKKNSKTSSNMIRCASHCQSISFWSRRQRWWRTCGNTSGRPRRIWLGDRHQYHCCHRCHHCFIFINIFTSITVIIVVIILSSSPLSSSVSLPSSLSSLFYHNDHHHHYHCNHPCHHWFIIIAITIIILSNFQHVRKVR